MTVLPPAPAPAPAPSPPLSVEEALVANHRQFLAFLERRVGDRALAEDILQDTFARGLSRVGSIRSQSSAVAWFYKSLRNAVIDHHRRRATHTQGLERLAQEMEAAEEPSPETSAALCACVDLLAATLPSGYAEALRRVELEAVPVKDFAAEQGISPQNAAVRVFRARAALRRQLERSCGTCAEHGCLDCTCRSGGGHLPQG